MMIKTRAVAALAAGILLATTGRSHAELTSRIQDMNFSAEPANLIVHSIVVPHDGSDWVVPAQAERRVDFTLSLDTETTRSRFKITEVRASLSFQGPAGAYLRYWLESQMAVLWNGSVDELDTDFNYAYLFNGARARNACRANYTRLRGEGLLHEEIISEDRWIQQNDQLFLAIRVDDTGGGVPDEGGNYEHDDGGFQSIGHWLWQSSWETVPIKCLADPNPSHISEAPPPTRPEPPAPKPAADDLRLAFHVQKIELSTGARKLTGVCPMSLLFKADVFATANGTAAVRFLTSGAISPELDVPVTSHWTGAFIGSRTFEVEIGKSGKGGFVAEPTAGTGGAKMAIETEDNVHKGVYWVEASNGVKSNNVGYEVTCTPAPFEPGMALAEPADTPTEPEPKGSGKLKAKAGANATQQLLMLIKPDLTIETVKRDGKKALKVLVRNAGTGDAGATSLKLDYQLRGEAKSKSTTVKPIAAGQQRWVRLKVGKRIAKLKNASLALDPRNRIDESNEGNNRYAVR